MFLLYCLRVRFSYLLAALVPGLMAQEPPTTWVDADTGHRVVRLTTEPGSASLYFNQNGYTADGKNMVYTTPPGISVLNLATQKAHPVVEGKVRVVVTGHKTQQVYYLDNGAVWAADVNTRKKHKIADLPAKGSIATVNADETLLAGTYLEGDAKVPPTTASLSADAQQPQILDQPISKG